MARRTSSPTWNATAWQRDVQDLSLPHRILLTTDAVGGVWTYSLTLAAGFVACGCQCVLAVLGPPPGPAQRAAAAAIPGLRLIETNLPLDWTATAEAELGAAAAKLDHIAAAVGAVTVHLHSPALAAFPWRAGLVAVAHSCVGSWWEAVRGGAPPADFAWRSRLMRCGLARADIVIAPSLAFAHALRRLYGDLPPIRVVHNGLAAPAALPQARRRRRVLTAGRLWDPGKNILLLDAVLERISVPIDAAGPIEGADGSRLNSTRLHLLGNLSPEELRSACRGSAIFAAPSLYEPFGLAVLEAAQCATPLLLADIPTFRELWDGAAVFCSPHDPAAWATAIRALLAAPRERARLGASARSRASHYTAIRMISATAAWHRAVHEAGPLRLPA
jgi:glycosyltransferase involved in cell wall biosynthesis